MSACLVSELQRQLARSWPRDLSVGSIYFGGGTPSLAEPSTIESAISAIRTQRSLSSDVEITLETNPTHIETTKLQQFSNALVNRCSIGIQALNDRDLAFFGREHSAAQAMRTVEVANKIFSRTSLDLMWGRPGQTVEAWATELKMAITLGAGHISLYQLTLESGTPLERDYRAGKFSLPNDDAMADMYEACSEIMEASGFVQYEVSNFARPGHASRHNQHYWLGQDYVGVGPGAHGRMSLSDSVRVATVQHLSPETWMNAVEQESNGDVVCETLLPSQRSEELLFLGLRTARGIDLGLFEKCAGVPLQKAVNMEGLSMMVAEGLMALDDSTLRCTKRGLAVVDSVLRKIML
eukprot:gnl/Spiro4/6944_TR3599_c0_g1_i2.p1 gnl/Spiro4/6944_TR3599_c0_g1~~gnl/Spiro4/6944_TR3599_c0_g1_i2.p1  ORF type:complete len:352 (+),score=63.43 gnl/Spiro4/6944_TR3599_c0_g1_i2:135-1190(+)